jgi:AraC-like DNA-binding protein
VSSSSSRLSSTGSAYDPAVVVAASAAGCARYYGFSETAGGPVRRREGPGVDIVLLVSFGNEWTIDDERVTSFAAGLYDRQVTTQHDGWSFGMQIDVAPPVAHALLGIPLHALAQRVVPLEDVLGEPTLADALHEASDWPQRFRLFDDLLRKRLAESRAASPEVIWAWRTLVATHGRTRVGELATELGWSRKRLAARFREQIGTTPKAFARMLRFERARGLATAAERPEWGRIAIDCGYYDQSHLINDFRAVTGRTPETFFQDTVTAAA